VVVEYKACLETTVKLFEKLTRTNYLRAMMVFMCRSLLAGR